MAAMDDVEDRGHLYGFSDPTAKRSKLQEIVEQREKEPTQNGVTLWKEAFMMFMYVNNGVVFDQQMCHFMFIYIYIYIWVSLNKPSLKD